MSNIQSTERILDAQDDEEIIEVDPDGNVTPMGAGQSKRGAKPTILRDPRGEY